MFKCNVFNNKISGTKHCDFCEMLHNKHRKPFTFSHPLTSFFYKNFIFLPNNISHDKSHEQNLHYDYHHSCKVINDYNKSQTVHFSLFFIENKFRCFFCCCCCCWILSFTHVFMFECNVIPKTKHSHLWNCSRLTSQAVHFFSPAQLILIWC